MQKKSLRLFLSVVMTSVALGFSHSGLADCDPMAVRQILEDGGWRFEAETDENSQGVFTIISDGIKARALVERTATLSSWLSMSTPALPGRNPLNGLTRSHLS